MPDPVTGLIASAGSSLIGGAMQSNAAEDASAAQSESAQAGIDEQRRQFEAIQSLLLPYSSAGVSALGQQQSLLGLGSPEGQQQAINAIQSGPQFQAMTQQGENAILQNASATGGLRGGNVQGALAQFRPQLLNQLIDQQFSRLGGLTSLGQNAAAGVGNAGMATGNSITNLLAQQGAARAGGALGQAAGFGNALGGIGQGVGLYSALGGFGGNNASPMSEPYPGYNAQIGLL